MEAAAGVTQGLPRAFLHSLRTLFDILDDERRGYVHIHEIETRWRGAEARELPPGVLHCLRKVAPSDGFLTFERFVLGLRSSMLNSQNRENCQMGALRAPAKVPGKVEYMGRKPQPLGVRYVNGTRPGYSSTSADKIITGGEATMCRKDQEQPDERLLMDHMAPAKVSGKVGYTSNASFINGTRPGHSSVNGDKTSTQRDAPICHKDPEQPGEEVKTMCRSHSESNSQGMKDQCRHQRSRGEARRHTITNGVDYGVLKRMKELEHEKDLLLQGLEMVERARDWYLQHMHSVQEQQRSLGKTDYFSDAGAINKLLPKLQEVNRCLGELIAPCRTAIHSPSLTNGTAAPGQAVNMLKEQNRLLTKEVTEKSDRITQLEQEKSALIKQLFEARARSHAETSAMDSTFI